jgi:DNA-binding transcriptional LysR family regulator
MASEPSWDLARTFLAVFRHGSLSQAARALRLSQPTAGRHIAELEAALETVLFVRSPSGLVPTAAAADLLPHAEAMAAAAGAVVRSVSGAANDTTGVVRITASEVVGGEVLPPILAGLRRAHAGITVELVLSNRNDDLLRREADIAVRMNPPAQQALVARRLGTIALGLHAHPDYLAQAGVPETLEQAAREHAMIGFDTPPAWLGRRPLLPLTRDIFAFRCDSDLAQLAAIRAGFGIGICQAPLARRDGLVAVLPDAFRFDLDVWITLHEDLRASRRVRLVADWLAEGLSGYMG